MRTFSKKGITKRADKVVDFLETGDAPKALEASIDAYSMALHRQNMALAMLISGGAKGHRYVYIKDFLTMLMVRPVLRFIETFALISYTFCKNRSSNDTNK